MELEEAIKEVNRLNCNGRLFSNTTHEAILVVLQALEEKDKIIDKLNKDSKDLLRKLRNRVKDIKKLEKYSTYKNEFSRLNKQLEGKDKIIYEMQTSLIHSSYCCGLKRDTCKGEQSMVLECRHLTKELGFEEDTIKIEYNVEI